MPILLLVLFLGAVIVYLRTKAATAPPSVYDPLANFKPDPNNPLPEQIQYDIELTKMNVSQSLTGQGQTLSPLQQAQAKKFSAIATMAGTATVLGVSAVSSLTLAAAGPIGAAVAGVIVAIGVFRGTAHQAANLWVTEVQNKFDAMLAQVIDAKDQAIRDGSASVGMLTDARRAITDLWGYYYQTAELWAQQSSDNREVIDNSYCWYIGQRCRPGKQPDPRFPQGFLTRLYQDIDAQIRTLAG